MAERQAVRPTGRPPRIDRTKIGLAGIALADERGLSAVTMRHVAARLESSPGSLYRHVNGRDDLVDLMVDMIIGQFPFQPVTGNWRTDLELFVSDLVQLHRTHRWLASAPVPKVVGPRTTRMLAFLLEALRAHPADQTRKLTAVAVMLNLVAGLAQWGDAAANATTPLAPDTKTAGFSDHDAAKVVVDAVGGVLNPDR